MIDWDAGVPYGSMTAPEVHLLLNHVPVLGTIFGLLLLSLAALRRSEELKRLGLLVFVLVGLCVAPVYLSGERAEDVVEDLPGVHESMIEEHEDSATFAAIGSGLLGVFSLWGLWSCRRERSLPRWLVTTVLTLAIVVAGIMARTAQLGGQIVHQELRKGFVPPSSPHT